MSRARAKGVKGNFKLFEKAKLGAKYPELQDSGELRWTGRPVVTEAEAGLSAVQRQQFCNKDREEGREVIQNYQFLNPCSPFLKVITNNNSIQLKDK